MAKKKSDGAIESSGDQDTDTAAPVARELGEATAPPEPPPAMGAPGCAPTGPPPIELTIRLARQSITDVKAPVAVVGRYKNTPPDGAVAVFDHKLCSWITHAIDLGMVGSNLGQLFFIPIPRDRHIEPIGLILAGMGEMGRFTRDDLRYLLTNVTYAIKAIGHNAFAGVVIGSGTGGFPKDRALRAMLDGVADGLERFPGSAQQSLEIVLVEEDPVQFRLVEAILIEAARESIRPNLTLTYIPSPADADAPPVAALAQPVSAPDVEPMRPPTRITISRTTTPPHVRDPANLGPIAKPPALVFQYAAMSDSAVIPVREVPVQSYFAEHLTDRLKATTNRADQASYGKLLANYLLPDDFRQLIETGESLTLVVDPDTAVYPWEMAGYRNHQGTVLFGPDLMLTRQFRTLNTTTPGIAPAINQRLNILIIADPAPPPFHLDGARAEGLKVVEVLKAVKAVWQDKIDLQVDVRIGSVSERGLLAGKFDDLRKAEGVVVSADVCDPLDILKLLLDKHFDVVHYAGHGIFDPDRGLEGWVLNTDCVLSAEEIFRVRQVPRLVFANACHSAEVNAGVTELSNFAAINERVPSIRQQVSLAEAFFQRGIQNYIGAGWKVDDAQALTFAEAFYRQVLGVGGRDEKITTAPPATLGAALAHARRLLLDADDGNTWAAYHHYGQVTAKLLAFKNVEAGTV